MHWCDSFDFGDAGSSNNDSFIQLVPTTNADAAWTEFFVSRSEALSQMPPVVDPAVALLLPSPDADNADDSSDSVSGGVETSSTPSSDDSSVTRLLDKYGPVALGLLAANLLLTLIALIVGVVMCLRGAVRAGARRAPSYTPVRLKENVPEDDYRSSTSYN